MNAITEIVNTFAGLWAGQMWTIIWQSSVLAGLVVIVTLLFRRLSAAVKFWLWMLVPLRLLVMPLITISLPLLPAIAPPHIEHVETAPAMVETPAAEYSSSSIENFVFPKDNFNYAQIETPPIEIQEQKTETNIVLVKPNLLTFIMILWFAGVAFWTVRLFWSWRKIRHIVCNAVKSDQKSLTEQASKAAAIVGLKKIPEILVTRENISPFLFGIFRPVLIIPSGFVNNVNEEGLAAVFSHEFAHLRRKDTLVGWILAICEVFYFFHPILHFAKRQILFERERACDDWVIASGNSHKKTYANALIDAAGICRNFSARLGPTGVVAESFGDLKKRIIAIGSNIKPKTRLSKSAFVLLILIGTICVPGFVLTNRTIASSENPNELLEKLKSMDELYTSALTLTGTDIRVPDYPDVPHEKIRWKISMHQDEFALEQISDEIYERKSSKPVDGLLGIPSMMMKAVVYMSKQRGGHHYIFGRVLEPGKAPEPEDNMISGQVLINNTKPDYFIVSKIRYLWSIGRYYSKYIDKIVEVSTDNNGILIVTAVGQGTSKIQGRWELQINSAAMYMVQEAKFTRFDSEGELSGTPEIIISNSGLKWSDGLCIPQEIYLTGLGQTEKVPISCKSISQKADVEFIKQANEYLDPPYKVQTSYSIRSGSSIIFDSIYEPDEEIKDVNYLANKGNIISENNDEFSEELLYLRQRNPSTFGVTALIESYEKFISKYQQDSRIAQALFELANIYEYKGDGQNYDKAMELFEKAAKTAAPNTDIWKKANIYWFNRLVNSDIQKAEKILLDMKNHLSENDVVLEAEIEDRYVSFYGIQKRFDEAEEHYSKVLELYKDRTKTTKKIEDRITIEDCYRRSSQTLLANIQYSVEHTAAERLLRIKKIGEKYPLFSSFNSYQEAIKQLENGQPVEIRTTAPAVDILRDDISGFVEDQGGHPIGSASVSLLNKELVLLPNPMKFENKTHRVITNNFHTQTGSDGSFRLADLIPGRTDVVVKAEKYQTKTIKDVSTGTSGLRVVLDNPAAYKLSGRVADIEGNPVKDVQITLARDMDKPAATTVRTNNNGVFEFDDVLEPIEKINSRLLVAQKEGFAIWGKFMDATGGESYVIITLLPEKTVTGRVVNDAGNPITGAKVTLSMCSGDDGRFSFFSSSQDIAPSVQTDTDGQFVFPGLPAKSSVSFIASAEGFVPDYIRSININYDGGYAIRTKEGITSVMVTKDINETEGGLEFVLHKGLTLRGKVTYEDTGLPVKGLRLATQTHKESQWAEDLTDESGQFEIKGVSPSTVNLFALFSDDLGKIPEWTAAAATFDDLEPSQIKENIKLIFVKGCIVSGKVTDYEGNPLKGIKVIFFSAARPPTGGAIQAISTAEDGTWKYRFPPGKVYIYLQNIINNEPYILDVKDGQEITDIDFKMPREVPGTFLFR